MQLCPASEEHVLAEPRGTATGPLPCRGIDDLQVGAPHDPVHTEARRLPGLPSVSMGHSWQERTPVTPRAASPAWVGMLALYTAPSAVTAG